MLQMTKGVQNEYRSFCRNELSAKIDGDGGICELDWIDCYDWKGVPFPDEKPLPIFSHDRAAGELAYGAAFQFYTREASGRILPHRPAAGRFTLSHLKGGDAQQTYELLLDDGRLLWELTCSTPERQTLLLALNRRCLFSGKLHSHKDQHRGIGTTQKGDHFAEAGVTLDTDLPDLNGTAEVRWEEDAFDEAWELLLYRGTAVYPYGIVHYVLAVGADAPLFCRIENGLTELCADWGDRPIRFGMALAHTEAEAVASLRDGLSRFDALRHAQEAEHEARMQDACYVEHDALPFAETFGRTTAAYLDSLTVASGIGVRAAAGSYGYFSLWDAIYPIRDFLWNGRYDDAARMLSYLLKLPAMENTPVSALHLVAQWNEARAFLPEWEDLYPYLLKIFRLALGLTEPRYHLLRCKANNSVDKPEQMGLSGLFLSPEVNGWWYNACRVICNEALRHGDEATARQAETCIRGIEQGFRRVFFDENVGYLHSGANADLSPAPVPLYHNGFTIGFDYLYGMYLMRDLVPALAHYQSHALWHPMGHRAVAFDSAIPSDWWRYVHMNQHNGHEMKLQRAANNVPEVHRVMGQVMARFDLWKNAEETTNFSRFTLHPDQVCKWQSFSATAQMEALRSAVAGILRHRGGLYYMPADDGGDVCVRQVPMGAGTIDIHVTGTGSLALLCCDGEALPGTLQLPADRVPERELTVRRTDAPAHPVLLCAADMSVREVTVHETALRFVCDETAMVPVLWFAASKPCLRVNGAPVPVEWDMASRRAWCDRLWTRGERVELDMKSGSTASR